MTELTTLLLEEHRRAAKEASSPERLMAHEFALARRLERKAHWWTRWSTRLWTGWLARRANGRASDGARMTPCEAC